jgi:hypothetical protein
MLGGWAVSVFELVQVNNKNFGFKFFFLAPPLLSLHLDLCKLS